MFFFIIFFFVIDEWTRRFFRFGFIKFVDLFFMEGVEERLMEIRGREDLIFLIVLFVFCKKDIKW